jgi:hypothetical protein
MLKKMIKRLALIVTIPIVLAILVLGYLGFVPVVSAMFGSDQPVDLSQAPSDADRVRANQKFQQTIVEPSGTSGLSILQSAKIETIDTTVTGPEAAAHIMERHPFSQLQIRINDDGSFESSGKIDRNRISQYLELFELTSYEGVDILKTVNRFLPGSPTFYVKGQGSVINNEATLDLSEARLGRVPLAPQQFADGIEAYVETMLERIPGLDLDALTIVDGQIQYDGTVPNTIPKY